MAWTSKPLFIGAHFWLVPDGTAITSPSASNVSQNGVWPDADEPLWANYKLGACESFDLDPKYGTKEEILVPSPGAVQAVDVQIPYAIPEVKFICLFTDVLAPQLALNTQKLFTTGVTQFNPNGGGGPGVRGILKAQAYDQSNNLILNWQSWAFVQLSGSWKGAPKTMTKPEFVATLLYSDNNTGSI
jgi:hypothetical protein